MKKRYPLKLFLMGFLMNFLRRPLLLLLSIVLLIFGIWVDSCKYIGGVLLAIDFALALGTQIVYVMYTMRDSDEDDQGWTDFQNAVHSKDWKNNMIDFVQSRMTDENQIGDDTDDNDDYNDAENSGNNRYDDDSKE